jgi:hypothetical protein
MADTTYLAKAQAFIDKAPKTNIKGKQYATVVTRIEAFRSVFGTDWGISTEMLPMYDENIVGVRAIICDENGVVRASGMAQEDRRMNKINETSSLEVAETSAIGRALACLGLLGGEYASAFEVEYAINAQEEPAKSKPPGKNVANKRPAELQEFRQAVVENFPPAVNQYTFLVPPDTDQEGVDIIFSEIDRIEDPDELTAYWNAIEHMMQWADPAIVVEIKGSFKARNGQLKG